MYRQIQKVRQKSDAERKRIVALTTTLLTALIALLWVVTLPLQFNSSPQIASVQSVAIAEEPGPLTTFFSSVRNAANFAWSQRSSATPSEILQVDEFPDQSFQVESEMIDRPQFLPIQKLEFLP